MSGDKLIGELQPVIENEKPKEKLEAGNDVMFFCLKFQPS